MGSHKILSTAGGVAATAVAVAASAAFPGPAHAAVAGPGGHLTPEAGERTLVLAAAQAGPAEYTVRPGDTLSAIAADRCGSAADWPGIASASRLADPNEIFPGEVLRLACRAAAQAVSGGAPVHDAAVVTHLSGTLGCAGLEALWEAAGGSHGEAFTAAEIAMAESGGSQFATGTAGERGYWQINPDHGALSTYDPMGNAKAAVIISDDGENWSPWTTWREGLEDGRC